MPMRSIIGFLLFAALSCGWVTADASQNVVEERHIQVALRKVGHQVLISAGDSTSRVLPIHKKDDRYIVQFESEFTLNPDALVGAVKRVFEESNIHTAYIVEVEECESGAIAYSYEILAQSDSVGFCADRTLSTGCYNLLFTLLDESAADLAIEPTSGEGQDADILTANSGFFPGLLFVLLLMGIGAFLWVRKHNRATDPDLIQLGEYFFDQRNTELLRNGRRIELTGKEAQLLLVLHDMANRTVEREVILNRVWGDQGDYVGRTLDVFISKLRKKLEDDSSLKIVNIRGVGYKLVMN